MKIETRIRQIEVKARQAASQIKSFFRRHWIGTVIILATTFVFFAPIIQHLNSYSSGGDGYFNAWVLARDQNCILRQNCPHYTDGNIYFPNKDTMLYSETELSVGLLTLPLRLISNNPVLSYNVWLIAGFFLSGWFMYLLAKRLSKGNEPYSVLSGLIFEFAPYKIIVAGHLQLVGVLFLPLAALCIIRYLDTNLRRYAVGLFVTLALLFYSSWYLMVFALATFGVMLAAIVLTKIAKLRQIRLLLVAIVLAVVVTLPLAKEYVRFSHATGANFGISEQMQYASSVADYFIPFNYTLAGKLYNHIAPDTAPRVPYSLDGNSSHGLVMYAIAAMALVVVVFMRKNRKIKPLRPWLIVWLAVGFTGFVMSLGPLLKFGGTYIYGTLTNGVELTIPLPYILLDKFFPFITFIRTTERWGVLVLLASAALVAYVPLVVATHKAWARKSNVIFGVLVALCVFELMPSGLMPVSKAPEYLHSQPPAVYKLIKSDDKIDNLIVLASDDEIINPGNSHVDFEWLLWAGYHNKNIFNGYSGYEPPTYRTDYAEFLTLSKPAIAKMKRYGLHYVLVDKHFSKTNPALPQQVEQQFGRPLYADSRYVLFKIPTTPQ